MQLSRNKARIGLAKAIKVSIFAAAKRASRGAGSDAKVL